ncbi:hypothetical protein BDY19DRAFT_942988 [Irpex rosettiformis]|uniref:Uncharacterized protein n=1 Tax=Irpex rosettiformis TaxID=378272 RepID=A0ACB8U5J3_9APHY|nr:hypothetical protein BDY19DRAFT_942988 [Irpex rosettiformis]
MSGQVTAQVSRSITTGNAQVFPLISKAEEEGYVHLRRGVLSKMLDIPLDVIMEICAHLQTQDMLHLSRLSKAFRALFTSRSMKPVWRAARLNVPGLPPCPEDLTELAYGNLLFDTSCNNCMARDCWCIYWVCRVRLCNKCSGALFKPGRRTVSTTGIA